MNFVKIEISGLPAIYPRGFVARAFTQERVKRIGYWTEVLETSNQFKTTEDTRFSTRKVQSATYNKYEVVFISKENYTIDQIELAEVVIIVTEQNESHSAKVLEFLSEKIQETDFRLNTITYADQNKANYLNSELPINNFLESGQLKSDYLDTEINIFRMLTTETIDSEWSSYGNEYEFWTKLMPLYPGFKDQLKVESRYFPQQIIKQIGFRLIQVNIYIVEADLQIFEKYFDKVTHFSASLYSGVSILLDNDYRPTYTKKYIGYGIYEVSIIGNYQKHEFTNAENVGKIVYEAIMEIDQELYNLGNKLEFDIKVNTIKDIASKDQDTATLDELENAAKGNSQKVLECELYLTESERVLFKKYLPMLSGDKGWISAHMDSDYRQGEGTVQTFATTNAVIGTNTNFDDSMIGSKIKVSGVEKEIIAVVSETSLAVDSVFGISTTGYPYYVTWYKAQEIPEITEDKKIAEMEDLYRIILRIKYENLTVYLYD